MPHRTVAEALGLASLAVLALAFFYVANFELTAMNAEIEQVNDLSSLLLVKKALQLAAKGYEVVIFIPRHLDSPIKLQGNSLTIHSLSVPLSMKVAPYSLEPGGWYKVFYSNSTLKVVLLK